MNCQVTERRRISLSHSRNSSESKKSTLHLWRKKNKETMVLAFFFFYKTAEIKSQIAFHCQQGKCLIRIIFFLYNHRSRDKEKNPPKVWLKKVPIGIKIPLYLCENTTCRICSGFEWKRNYSQSMMQTLSLILQDEKLTQLTFNSSSVEGAKTLGKLGPQMVP